MSRRTAHLSEEEWVRLSPRSGKKCQARAVTTGLKCRNAASFEYTKGKTSPVYLCVVHAKELKKRGENRSKKETGKVKRVNYALLGGVAAAAAVGYVLSRRASKREPASEKKEEKQERKAPTRKPLSRCRRGPKDTRMDEGRDLLDTLYKLAKENMSVSEFARWERKNVSFMLHPDKCLDESYSYTKSFEGQPLSKELATLQRWIGAYRLWPDMCKELFQYWKCLIES